MHRIITQPAGLVNASGSRGRAHGLGAERWRALGTERGVAEKHATPLGRFRPALEHPSIDQRPAVEVVIHITREDEAVDERGVEKEFLKAFERAEPDEIAAAKSNEILADVKVPVLFRRVGVAHNLDVPRVTDAQAVFVREEDVIKRERI